MQGYSVLALRYAQSLASLAKERGVLDTLYNDMQQINNIYSSDAEFRAFLRSPVINALTKQTVLIKIFAGNANELTTAFLKKLADSRRELYLGEIAKAFIAHYKKLKGVLSVHVTSAIALGNNTRQAIMDRVKQTPQYAHASEIELIEKIDASIIGGLIIRVDDKQLDTSFSSQIHQFRRAFEDNPYIIEY
ncbi:MAG: ATP synthase F1 subunit delta [Candidatus Competibacteraceae bacterium]|nr:ATP synthase F1 subunit delta [Candidatus Competibacteraceae bacterium]